MTNDSDGMTRAFRTAGAALERNDWLAAAMLCDPASLMAFKRRLVERVEQNREVHSITVEKLVRLQPDMPRAAAEYQVAMHNQFVDPMSILHNEVPGVRNLSDLKTMTPAEVFAAHLSAGSLEHQIEVASRFTRVPPEVVEHARTGPRPVAHYTVLGTVLDGERMGFVIFHLDYVTVGADDSDQGTDAAWAALGAAERSLAADIAKGPPQCAGCRRQPDGTWRLIAENGFLGTGNIAFSLGGDGDQ
jgi:hypothetical protein